MFDIVTPYANRRHWIIGSGSSLNNTPLERLKGEITCSVFRYPHAKIAQNFDEFVDVDDIGNIGHPYGLRGQQDRTQNL